MLRPHLCRCPRTSPPCVSGSPSWKLRSPRSSTAQQALREAKDTAEQIVETVREPLLVLTPDFRVQSANPAFYHLFQVRPTETVGQSIYQLGNGQWDIPELHTLLEQILPQNTVFNDYEVTP